MNWKNTWLLLGIAAALFAFIFLYERHLQTSDAVQAPEALLNSFKATSATSIQLRRGNSFVVSLVRTNGEWRYTAPFSYPAATLAVDGLLEMLEQVIPATYISPQEMVARKQTPADFGFDAPAIFIKLQQGNEVQNIRFGARTPANDQVYVDVGRPGIYVVSSAVFDRLPRTENAWRDPALVPIPAQSIDRVEVAAATAGGFELRRDATNKLWRLSRPAHRADQLKAAYLVKQLAEAQVTSFVLDDPRTDLDTFGLQSPAAEVTLAGGGEVHKIQFGRSPTNDPTQVYARQVTATNVVLVPKAVLELVTTNAYSEYRDRRLIAFAPENVQSVEIKSAEPYTALRQANGTWTVAENPVDSLFVNQWLTDFSRIDIREFAKDVVTDPAPFGLANPRVSVVLRIALPGGGMQTNRIDFGTNDTAQTVLVRRADEDSVYSISALELLHTPAAPWQLREHRVWSFTTNQVVRVVAREGGRTRQLLRQPNGQWASTTGEVNPFAMEEMMFGLGALRAVAWVDRGEQALARNGFAPENYEVAIDVKEGDKTQTLTLRFAKSVFQLYFATTTIDGQPWVFEFPWPLFIDLQRYLSVSPAGAGL